MEAKEERQRLMLGGVLLLGALYGYFGLLLSPISQGIKAAVHVIADRTEQTTASSAELRKLREEMARLDRPILDAAASELLETVPKSHLATTPPILFRILDEHHLPKREARSAMLLPFNGRQDLQRAVWEMKLREADALHTGEAIAALENEFRLGEIREVSLETNSATGTVDATIALELVIRL